MKKFGYAFWQSQRDALEKMYYEDKLNSNEIGAIYGVRGTTITSNMRRMGFV